MKTSRPIVIRAIKWTLICSAEKRNKLGADFITSAIDPAAPDAAKNICMNKMPTALPVVRNFEKNLGNTVADATVNKDISGNDDVPVGRKSLVNIPPDVTRQDATDIEVPKDAMVILPYLKLELSLSSDKSSGSTGTSSEDSLGTVDASSPGLAR